MCEAEWAELDKLNEELDSTVRLLDAANVDNDKLRAENAALRRRTCLCAFRGAKTGPIFPSVAELEAEISELREILDGCDDAAIDRAARALCPIEWDESDGPVVTTYRTQALKALRAAGELPPASDEQEATG